MYVMTTLKDDLRWVRGFLPHPGLLWHKMAKDGRLTISGKRNLKQCLVRMVWKP